MTGFAPKYDLFVFDWDGTVMDTTALIAKGIQHAAREMGYPVPSFQDACGEAPSSRSCLTVPSPST